MAIKKSAKYTTVNETLISEITALRDWYKIEAATGEATFYISENMYIKFTDTASGNYTYIEIKIVCNDTTIISYKPDFSFIAAPTLTIKIVSAKSTVAFYDISYSYSSYSTKFTDTFVISNVRNAITKAEKTALLKFAEMSTTAGNNKVTVITDGETIPEACTYTFLQMNANYIVLDPIINPNAAYVPTEVYSVHCTPFDILLNSSILINNTSYYYLRTIAILDE